MPTRAPILTGSLRATCFADLLADPVALIMAYLHTDASTHRRRCSVRGNTATRGK
jgi:hypothetical protein